MRIACRLSLKLIPWGNLQNAESGYPYGLSGGGWQDFHDFDPGPGVDIFQQITVPVGSGFIISFQWNAPFFSVSGGAGSPNDIDIFITSNGTEPVPLAAGVEGNVGGDPVELVLFVNNGTFNFDGVPGPDTTFNIAIANFSCPNPGFMKYVRFDLGPGVTINQFNTASGTLYGHANAAGAEAVGTADYRQTPEFGTDPPVKEFSSAGPTRILFKTNGTSTFEERQKPEIVAPDGTNTTFSGGSDPEGDGFPNFYGTSAAAPHAAGVAALLLEADGSALDPASLYSALERTAADMGAAGFDFDSGFGLVRADLALDLPAIQSLTADLPAPQQAGTTITFTAVATGGSGSYEFQWLLFDGTSWVQQRDWGPGNTFAWTPWVGRPDYKIGVWVRNAGQPSDDPKSTASVPFTITLRNMSGDYTVTGSVTSSTCPSLLPPGTPINIPMTLTHVGTSLTFTGGGGTLTGTLTGTSFTVTTGPVTVPIGGCVITETVTWSGTFNPTTGNFTANGTDVASFNEQFPGACGGFSLCTALESLVGTRVTPLQFEELKTAPGTTGIMQFRQRFKLPEAP